MTDQRIVYTNDKGQVCVVCPAPKARRAGETEEDFVARIAAKDVPAGKTFQIMPKTALPSRRFRNCWKVGQAGIEVDLAKAGEQVMAEVRRERNKRLAESDALKIRADDIGTPQVKSEIAEYRQALRDFPELIQAQVNAATSAADLEAVAPLWPEHPESA